MIVGKSIIHLFRNKIYIRVKIEIRFISNYTGVGERIAYVHDIKNRNVNTKCFCIS